MSAILTDTLAALASRLTSSGDYEGVDVIDTASARIARLEARIEGLRAMHKLIATNLGEYIDRKGFVDVVIALAFETARAALGSDAG